MDVKSIIMKNVRNKNLQSKAGINACFLRHIFATLQHQKVLDLQC